MYFFVFSRLPQDVYQTAKVAKVLLLLEKGKGKYFRGKALNEIELDKDIYYSSEEEIEPEKTESGELLKEIENIEETAVVALHDRNNQRMDDKKLFAGKLLPKDSVQIGIYREESVEEHNQDRRNTESKKLQKENHKNNDSRGRIPWSKKEKIIVLRYFEKHVKLKITPKKHECQQFIQQHGDKLQNKDWVRVKTLVYNTFRKK